jgi:phospholipase C
VVSNGTDIGDADPAYDACSSTDQSSILRFIEDNWQLGRIGDQSFDAIAGTLNNMFDFTSGNLAHKLFLDPATGEKVRAPSNA